MIRFAQLTFLFFIIGLLSCQRLVMPEFKSYDQVSIDKIGFNHSTLSMNLHYYNPNKMGILLDKTNIDIYINNNILGHSNQELGLSIPKKSDFMVPLKVQIEMKNLFKNSLATLLNKEITIKIVGKICVRKGKISLSLPVNYTTKQEFSL